MGFGYSQTIAIFVLMATGLAQRPCKPPLWAKDLTTGGFESFRLPTGQRGLSATEWWRAQQGIVFTSPQTLAVFQVQKTDEPKPLGPREASGGSGSFVLHISFLDAQNGKIERSLDLTTEASGYSRVYPTHDGRLLVRTGDVLRVYSPDLKELASRRLQKEHSARNDWWSCAVNKSGTQVYLQHYEYFGSRAPGHTENLLVDADNLETISILDAKDMARVKEDFLFVQNRDRLKVHAGKNEQIASMADQDSMILAEIWHKQRNPFDMDPAPKPLRVAVYNPAESAERCSIAISSPVSGWVTGNPFSGWEPKLYALSSAGTVAILQEHKIELYQP